MKLSSADFTRLSLQEVVDMLLDRECKGAICKGMVDDKLYSLKVELIIDE